MPTKANGLLYADYARAMKARARFGAKKVRVYLDGSIEFSFVDEGDEAETAAPEPDRPAAIVDKPAHAQRIRAATIEIIRDGAWNNKMPWKTLAVELVKRGHGQHHWTTLRWALDMPPMITGRLDQLPPEEAPPEIKLRW
jgi:hypothetical protein